MMTPHTRTLAAAAVLALRVMTYPAAPRSDAADTYHGERVPDPFRPLEDTDSAPTRQWVAEQSARRDTFMRAVVERPVLERRLLDLATYESFSPPVKGGGR